MVAVVQLVEHQVVILAVAGSSPVSHPEQKHRLTCTNAGGAVLFSRTIRYPIRYPLENEDSGTGTDGTKTGRFGVLERAVTSPELPCSPLLHLTSIDDMSDTRITALCIYADSSAPPRPSKVRPDVELYQKIIGGHFQAVYGTTDDGEQVVIYVNEDGIRLNLPVNEVARRLWRRLNPSAHQPLLGNAVVIGADECDDADLPIGVADLALSVHRDIEIEGYVRSLREQGGARQ